MEAGSYGFRELRRRSFGIGLVGSWESPVVRRPSPRQVHRDLDIVVGGAWGIRRVVCLLPRRLLGVVGTLVPVALLHATSELLEGVLWAVVWDSSPGPYRFNHLSGFSVLDSLCFVLLIGLREWWGDDCV
jgi:hypothetical protein